MKTAAMKEIPVQSGMWHDGERMGRVIETVMLNGGLRQTLKGALRRYPGCVHWHFGKDGATGTLEVTMWPAGRRVWMSVQSRRGAVWIDDCLSPLRIALERGLGAMTKTD